MDINEHSNSPVTAESPRLLGEASRWRALAERLGGEVEQARRRAAEAEAQRDAATERLRRFEMDRLSTNSVVWMTDRELAVTQTMLDRARAHIARTQPYLRTMRQLIGSMQDSKFWRARNAWFALKQRLRINASGPQPRVEFEPDDVDPALDDDLDYEAWRRGHDVRADDLRRMRDVIAMLAYRPRFSVLVPVYDTPEILLRAALESVFAQVYPDWELCIADDASAQPHVRRVLEEYAARDRRVRVAFRETNGHIAATSNTALAAATGDFVVLLDHDDLLAPNALFENALLLNAHPDADMIYSDEDKIDESGRRSSPYFKPDWSPDSFLARMYTSHLGVYRRELVRAIGGFREGFEGSQDYDLVLRLTERTDRIHHIPQVLYHWRVHSGSTASGREQKGYAYEAATRALSEALERRGEPGRVEPNAAVPGLYTVRYAIRNPGRVSIIIPTRDHGEDVDRCLTSIFAHPGYDDLEIVLLDNGSRDPDSLRVFGRWAESRPDQVKLVRYDAPFNFSAINNHAVRHANGAYLLFLNNDTEVITPDWLGAMVEHAQRPGTGAVGAKLLYDDGSVQHAGVVIGLGGVAGHSHKHYEGDAPGYFYTLQTVNNYSAVTAACMMVRRAVFDEVGGFDEQLAIAFNDVDFCLRVRAAGYYNVYLPHVELYHHESKSRGYEDTPEKIERFLGEQTVMLERWSTDRRPDPHYNPNLTLLREDYAIAT
jgi:GT2 family glycosyltransferase